MTREEVRAAARKLTVLHERFASLFGRKEAQEHSQVYVKGLLSGEKRKSIEPLALQFARRRDGAAATQNEVVALQGFITHSPWKEQEVFPEIQAVFAEELMPTAAQDPIGIVGVKRETPELTLDLALRASFARTKRSEDEAMDLIDYYLERNKVAHQSHRKTWLAKHKQLAKKLLL
jgi:hypothetical protein